MGFSTARVKGPLRPQAGPVYRVVYRDRVYPTVRRTSIPASLTVCLSVATNYNRRAKAELASVEYINDESR